MNIIHKYRPETWIFLVSVIIILPISAGSQPAASFDNNTHTIVSTSASIVDQNWGRTIYKMSRGLDTDEWGDWRDEGFSVASGVWRPESTYALDSSNCVMYTKIVPDFEFADNFRVYLDLEFLASDLEVNNANIKLGYDYWPEGETDVDMLSIANNAIVGFSHTKTGRRPVSQTLRRNIYDGIIHAENNFIVIEKIGTEIRLYINDRFATRYTTSVDTIDETGTLSFMACEGARWAVNSIEIQTQNAKPLREQLKEMLEYQFERAAGSSPEERGWAYTPNQHTYMNEWVVGNQSYMVAADAYFTDGEPDLSFFSIRKVGSYETPLVMTFMRGDLTGDVNNLKPLSPQDSGIYPASIADVLIPYALDHVVEWFNEHTHIVFDPFWDRSGQVDLRWRLIHPRTSEFSNAYATFVYAYSGYVRWSGDQFISSGVKPYSLIVEGINMKLLGEMPLFGSYAEFTALLGNDYTIEEAEISCDSGIYYNWDGVVVEYQSSERMSVLSLDFENNSDLWLSIFEGFRLSAETTLDELFDIVPAIRNYYENRSLNSVETVSFQGVIPWEVLDYFRFKNQRLISFNMDVPC